MTSLRLVAFYTFYVVVVLKAFHLSDITIIQEQIKGNRWFSIVNEVDS